MFGMVFLPGHLGISLVQFINSDVLAQFHQLRAARGTDYGDAVWGGLVTLKRRLVCCRRSSGLASHDPPTQAEIQDGVRVPRPQTLRISGIWGFVLTSESSYFDLEMMRTINVPRAV